MDAAQGTVDFVQAWVDGKLTKRQHMHYYVVKMPDAEFLMKKNKDPELVAIRDLNGFIFILAEWHRYGGYLTDRLNNPLYALLHKGHKFPHSVIDINSFTSSARGKDVLDPRMNISKWRTKETFTIQHKIMPLHYHLIEIDDAQFFTGLSYDDNFAMSMDTWSTYEDIKNIELHSDARTWQLQPTCMLFLLDNKVSKYEEIRQRYVDFAKGETKTTLVMNQWIFVPTKVKDLDTLLSLEVDKIIKTRPVPQHYGIPSNFIDANLAWARMNFPFEPSQLDRYGSNFINFRCFNRSEEFTHSVDWKQSILKQIDKDIAHKIIKFIEEDDAWLEQHRNTIKPLVRGQQLTRQIFGTDIQGLSAVLPTPNPITPSTLYIRGRLGEINHLRKSYLFPQFTAIVPSPHNINRRLCMSVYQPDEDEI